MTKAPQGSPPDGQAADDAQREAAAFDRWLRRQLRDLYGSIAAEPPDDELIALIDRDARATSACALR